MKSIKFSVSGAILILIFFLAACDSAATTTVGETTTLTTVNIGFPSAGGNWAAGTLGVAYEFGYLAAYLEPLGFTPNVTGFVGAAPALHEALIAGDLDLVNYAGFAAVLGRASGIETSLLAVTSYHAPWSLIVAADSGIETLVDLTGRKIAYTRGASPHMYLLRVLSEAGIDFSEITDLNMTIPEGLAALATGSVDAAVISNGQGTDLIEAGYAQILHTGFASDPAVYFEPMVSIGRSSFVEENPEVAVAYLSALLSARDRIAADPNAYYELFAQRSGNHIDVILASAQVDKVTGYPLSLANNYLDRLRDIQDFQLKNDLISSEFDIDSWYVPDLLNQALEEYANER